MAQSAVAIRPRSNKQERLHNGDQNGWSSTQRHRVAERLYFFPETRGFRTPFRDAVLNYIHRTALDLSDGHLESAVVSVWSHPGEEDSLTLDLSLTLSADWNTIGKLRRDILVKLGEWSQEWSEGQKEDYGRRIYFGLLPSNL